MIIPFNEIKELTRGCYIDDGEEIMMIGQQVNQLFQNYYCYMVSKNHHKLNKYITKQGTLWFDKGATQKQAALLSYNTSYVVYIFILFIQIFGNIMNL